MQVPALPESPSPLSTARSAKLMQKARQLETTFLTEMLSYTGVDSQKGDFTGGIGEDQFSSMLRETQAKAMADHGGIGLAKNIFDALVRCDHVGE
ncbi:hypothetical protein GC209_00550 [bacterium]|nr:hypothetical protein [bacterium]